MKGFWDTHKEELKMIPVVLVILMLFKLMMTLFFPKSSQFDLWSEFETLLFNIFRLLFLAFAAWGLMKITFPNVHRSLVYFYHDWDERDTTERKNIAYKMFFVILLSLVVLNSFGATSQAEQRMRAGMVTHLETQLYIREATNNNDGPEIKAFLNHVGLPEGYDWCAAYNSYQLSYFGVPNPMSAWSPNFAKQKDIVWSQSLVKQNRVIMEPQPGDCFTIWNESLKRVRHTGMIVGKTNTHFITNEGNTNNNGSATGIGVFSLKRDKRKVYAVTNYITPHINNIYEASTSHLINPAFSKRLYTNEAITKQPSDHRHSVDGEDRNRTGHHSEDSTRQRTAEVVSESADGQLEVYELGREKSRGSVCEGFHSVCNRLLRLIGVCAEDEGYSHRKLSKPKGREKSSGNSGKKVHTPLCENNGMDRGYHLYSAGSHHCIVIHQNFETNLNAA